MSYIGNQPVYQAFVTDQFSGNGSTTAFTMSVAPANTASVLVAVSGVLQDPSTYSVSGTTLTFSAAPPSGTGNISARYLGIPASGVTTTAYRTVTEFTATAGQTTFTPPSYTVGYINVYRNGVRLNSADYTASNGTTVVLTTGATAGDTVTTESFYVSSVLNAIPATAGAVNSTYLAANLSLVTPSVTTTLGVGGATPAASGAGITFPATQSASTDANTLDDYEEGTWTPTLNANLTASSNYTTGQYIKIGKLCYINYAFAVGTVSGSNAITVSLPFTGASAFTNGRADQGWAIYTSGVDTGGIGTLAYIGSGSTNIEVYGINDNAAGVQITNANLAVGDYIFFNLCYQTA